MQFTHSQQSAIATFLSFLNSDEQIFILKGAAGTGKTTLVSEFLKILDAQNREYALMAPTGRAAYIIGSKTGRPAFTIHRCIYGLTKLRSIGQNKDDEDDGGLHLRFCLKTNQDSLRAVYLVDEASMVSDTFSENEAFSFGSGCLLTDLFEFAHGRKIVLIGDYAQLPPIGMNFSPALDKEYLENKFSSKVKEITLREVLRQSHEGAMLPNATRIRECIENKTFIEFNLQKGPDSIAENIDLLHSYYDQFASKPSVKAAIITYSNKQALDYNLAIRKHYYGNDTARLNNGDLLLVCRNNYSYEYELFNGNIVLVEACQSDNNIIQRDVRVKLGNDRIESVCLKFRNVTIRFGVNGKPASLNVMLLDNFLDDPSSAVGGLLARALIVDFNNRLPENIKSHLNEIRRLLRAKTKLTTDQQELCDTYLKLLNADSYYNAVICKYGYAMTCHKAQGGEWDYVFVDMGRFGGTSNEDYFRWAYTALTRASKKIWYYRSPEYNYMSNLIVEDIKLSPNIKVSTYSTDSNFCETRMERIRQLCAPLSIVVSENLSKSFQHIITFKNDKHETATFQLWYKASGYNGKQTILSSTSNDFAILCSGFLENTFIPTSVPFEAKDRPFAEKLTIYMKSLIKDLGIQLLDITQEQYQDVFHLKTEGLAKVGFRYTNKGNYTYMTLISSIGNQDTKLISLRQKFL